MFSIWVYAWLPPSPAKRNLSDGGVCASFPLPERTTLKSALVRVQGDVGGDVPRPKVERLRLARGLTQHLSFLKVCLLLLRGKNEEEGRHL